MKEERMYKPILAFDNRPQGGGFNHLGLNIRTLRYSSRKGYHGVQEKCKQCECRCEGVKVKCEMKVIFYSRH
jgi:hypothetical protein